MDGWAVCVAPIFYLTVPTKLISHSITKNFGIKAGNVSPPELGVRVSKFGIWQHFKSMIYLYPETEVGI